MYLEWILHDLQCILNASYAPNLCRARRGVLKPRVRLVISCMKNSNEARTNKLVNLPSLGLPECLHLYYYFSSPAYITNEVSPLQVSKSCQMEALLLARCSVYFLYYHLCTLLVHNYKYWRAVPLASNLPATPGSRKQIPKNTSYILLPLLFLPPLSPQSRHMYIIFVYIQHSCILYIYL